VPRGWVLPTIVDRVVDFAAEQGIQRRRLEAIVGARPGLPIGGDAAHAVLTYVVRELGDSASVWQFADRARPADYGPYGFALQASDTVGDALLRAARFFATIATTAEITVSTGPKTAEIVVRRRDGAKTIGAQLGTQYLVGQMVRLIGAITGEKVRPRAIRLQHHPLGRDALEGAGGVVPQFRALVTAIEIDREALDVPLPRRDPDLTRHFDEELARDEDPSAAALVRRAMKDAIAIGTSHGENDIARGLGLGTRTLRRRLAREGTTMREVLDGVRLALATERLRHSRVNLAELAFELGFSDQTALSRAFRRWTGRSPAAFRRGLAR
jgi:AraC-like DNA-binding protein